MVFLRYPDRHMTLFYWSLSQRLLAFFLTPCSFVPCVGSVASFWVSWDLLSSGDFNLHLSLRRWTLVDSIFTSKMTNFPLCLCSPFFSSGNFIVSCLFLRIGYQHCSNQFNLDGEVTSGFCLPADYCFVTVDPALLARVDSVKPLTFLQASL